MAEDTEKTEAATVKSPFDMKMLIIFGVVIVLAVGITTFGVVKFLAPTGSVASATKTEETASEGSGSIYTLPEDLITNLADKNEDHYIKFKLAVEVSDAKLIEKEKAKEIDPMIRHYTIALLRKKTSADLKGPDGFNKLAKELKDELNKNVFHNKLKQVFISEFTVQ